MTSRFKSRPVLVALMAVAGVAVLMRWSGGLGIWSVTPAVADDVESGEALAAAHGEQELRDVALPAAWLEAVWPSDPFRRLSEVRATPTDESLPPRTPTFDKPPFELKATMVGTVPMALIDGRALRLGDIVGDGWEVTEISAVSVALRGRNGALVLRLPQ